MKADVLKEGLKFINEINEFCGNTARLIIRDEAETDPSYGCLPVKRSMEDYIKRGIINLDKPPGPTSHEVVPWIKKMFNLKKAGHGGTLEPLGYMA